MRLTDFLLYMVLTISAVSCLDGKNRCGNLTWDPTIGICIDESATIDSEPDEDAGGDPDGGEDSEAEPILGEACTSDEDCAVYNADYCLVIPNEPEGFCTLLNCSAAPDNCPSGYTCCMAPADAFYPTHCMADDVFEQSGAMLCEL